MNKNNTILLLVSFLIITVSCATKNEVVSGNNTGGNTVTKIDKGPDREFLKEGFINNSTFRVVILSTKEECEQEESALKERSQKRALVSLKKYIAAKGRSIGTNTQAGILQIIDRKGSFSRKSPACIDNCVYYFEIKEQGIRRKILKLGKRR